MPHKMTRLLSSVELVGIDRIHFSNQGSCGRNLAYASGCERPLVESTVGFCSCASKGMVLIVSSQKFPDALVYR